MRGEIFKNTAIELARICNPCAVKENTMARIGNPRQLSVYTCLLIGDGKTSDAKQMILTK